MKVLSNKLIKMPIKVYDFTVDEVHHYILSNGVVSHNSFFPTNEVAGGGGLKYSGSTIVVLAKKKEKEGTEVIGNIIKMKNYKSRFTIENKTASSMLNYTMGLDRYYGLLEIGETDGVCKKVGTKWEIGGQTAFQKAIYKDPEKYFTKDVLDRIDIAAGKLFKYGSSQPKEEVVIEEKPVKKASKKKS